MTEDKTEVELTFFEKVSHVINELKAPKNQYNSFGKYKYRSAEDILEGVKPIAFKYGLIPNLSDEVQLVGDRYYIVATASITDGTLTMRSTGVARESEVKKGMDDSQISGTASSYARKYAMNGLYQIDDTKDADTDEYKQAVESAKPKKITKAKVDTLVKKFEALSKLASEKTGNEISPKQMEQKCVDTKFLQVFELDQLDTDQFMTLNRYIDELTKAYQKQKA